ncbi:hypothetical protein HYPBUDRAFT_152641 [Hyphopichia burtonii NRRL Y-1933]|uniref:Uncharacterized protein n=1 Tax=Hyphopichia burtonii NRRL Y-1933 TaxID=984485 RepID=A0A1E4RKW0_9ASCO|nr:hypothetical protein HYPBUDRAFT_152641 [Hyphopichia burtonii NRRL Y-1933]ODV67909.1 hypothetical protein HYPBUDRAFT_152641 [Hyphopichia burtonii NRRL Y-1933]
MVDVIERNSPGSGHGLRMIGLVPVYVSVDKITIGVGLTIPTECITQSVYPEK